VADTLVLVQSGERLAIRSAATSEGERTFAVADASFPIQMSATVLPESWYDVAQFRMHARTVVALIVIFGDDLPVGCHIIGDPARAAEFGERVSCDSLGNGAELSAQI
jgi:hypothetical protein